MPSAGIAQSVEHLFHLTRRQWYDRPWSGALSRLVRKYEAENDSAVMLATHTAGVAPEVNLGNMYTLRMPPPGENKAAYSDFETQRRRHQKSKHWYHWPHKKVLMSSKNV